MADKDILEQLRSIDFGELEVEHIGVWPFPLRVIILIAVVVLVLIGGYYFHISDLNAEFKVVQGKEAELKKVYEDKAHQVANLEAYKRQMVELEESFGALLGQLPSDTEVPGLLEDITDIGHGSSLNIESIALQPEKAAEFYVELPIKIKVSGGYHDFGTFVSGIAGLPRIVTLHDYLISSTTGSGLLTMEIEARTYRYKAGEQ
ncbi:MAG: type 4a pilus biogenesis protein PilO [bacterium]